MFVARDSEGQLLKIPIPLHYLYVFVVGAVIGMITITGMAGSYSRMLAKTLRFNQLRNEEEALKKNYTDLEKVAEAKERQVASLSSLAPKSPDSTASRLSRCLMFVLMTQPRSGPTVPSISFTR